MSPFVRLLFGSGVELATQQIKSRIANYIEELWNVVVLEAVGQTFGCCKHRWSYDKSTSTENLAHCLLVTKSTQMYVPFRCYVWILQ